MLHQERVQRDPVPGRDRPPQLRLGLLRALGADQPEPVRDPVDVGVDRDRRDPVAEDQDAVRGLRSDPGKARERREVARHRPLEPRQDLRRAAADRARLRAVESRAPDQRLDLLDRRGGERLGGTEPREKGGARDVGRLVPGALGEDRPDQDLERVLGVVPEIGDPPVAGAVVPAEPVEDRGPREPRGRHGRPAPIGSPGPARPGSERSGSSRSAPGVRARRTSPTR